MPQWKQFSGNWTVTQQMQARGGDEWPAVPGAPTIGTATAGNAQASVAFTAPANLGIPAVITQYTVTSSPGGLTATGSASPIVVTGLSNGTAYTFTVTATNATGTGPASAASNSVTPENPFYLYSFGKNDFGQLGTNNVEYRSSPVQIGNDSTWAELAGGTAHTLATKSDGTLWAWGKNTTNGQLGDDTTITKSSPVQIGALTTWLKVAAGGYSSFAIKNDGTLWAWGNNGYGQLGQGNRVNKSSPVQVGALTTWDKIFSTNNGTIVFVAAIKTDGTLWMWGNNSSYNFGNGSQETRSSPVQIGVETNWLEVACGEYFSLAINTDYKIYSAGSNSFGRTGQNTTVNQTINLTQIGSLTNWKDASARDVAEVVKTDGTLWTWGNTQSLNLSFPAALRSSPVQVGSLDTWSKIFNGMAIKTDGTLWAWGSNSNGQLGDGTTVNKSSPIQVGSATDWQNGSPSSNFRVATRNA